MTLKPDYAAAHSNFGLTLHVLERFEEAITYHRRAISLDPQNDSFWANYATSLETASFASVDDNIYQDLLHLLDVPTVSPDYIIRPIISALRHHSYFSALIDATKFKQRNGKISYHDVAERLSGIKLFLQILQLTPLNDLEIERMLTVLRQNMLRETMKGETDGKGIPFSAALALQCFTNEYIFPETDEEKEAIETLQQKIDTLLGKGQHVPPTFVVALGAYRPLFSFSWAQKLSESKWPGALNRVIKRQITEPRKERSLRKQISCLTPIQNTVSQSVREQFEENPWPLWIKTDIYYKSRSIGNILRGPPLYFDLGDYTSPESPEVLVAGCGTGQHALYTASRFSNAHVLALDLSLNSLAYAERKTRELGFSNIEYAQGDITELEKLERQFDLIECLGVLHHLGNPLAGWQILVNLLRPKGLIKIGLYSKVARQHIISWPSLTAGKRYTTSLEDIRRCRQDIMAMAGNGNTNMARISNYDNFFSVSGCRDLLFPAQEQRFTLPQIEAALRSLHLKFLGFEMQDRRPLRMFRESYPDSHDATSLSLWHEFELKNPDTFGNMYQFWCKKL